ncbi:SCP2 sterol-binding domain-containing protein [Pandoraea sp. XJJ-1]|uniref:ubiquinone biosynthesis accessory factor UbiJ n=1 Tax=Pandoraea sp. XJJ-1 TaxID=3002643 RepID=UPI00227DA4FC|nr:SCP2 sterol-binding domain-containing protein [Pandoraea sp. XJJ-1]WAL83588.1 SCP2 sterol-binding domain-containing protein [Pandoraea sp. XJJ-1]
MTVAAKAFAATVNHLLAREPWARDRLRHHIGASARLAMSAIDLRLRVGDDGYLVAADANLSCDVSIAAPPAALADFAGGGQAAVMRHVKIEGDAEFANTVSYLAQHLRWDVAEDLSKVIGDAAAHRVTETGKAAVAGARRTGGTLARSLADYLVEENPLLVGRGRLDAMRSGIGTLRDDLARLEKRLEKLERQTAGRDAAAASVSRPLGGR